MDIFKKKDKKEINRDISDAEKHAHELQKQGRGRISSDILGSYTGTPEKGKMPEQDADDL